MGPRLTSSLPASGFEGLLHPPRGINVLCGRLDSVSCAEGSILFLAAMIFPSYASADIRNKRIRIHASGDPGRVTYRKGYLEGAARLGQFQVDKAVPPPETHPTQSSGWECDETRCSLPFLPSALSAVPPAAHLFSGDVPAAEPEGERDRDCDGAERETERKLDDPLA